MSQAPVVVVLNPDVEVDSGFSLALQQVFERDPTLGVAGGLGLCELLSRYQFIELPSNVYPMTTLPIKVLPTDVTIIAISSVVITLLATLYPSWKASTVHPAEVLS